MTQVRRHAYIRALHAQCRPPQLTPLEVLYQQTHTVPKALTLAGTRTPNRHVELDHIFSSTRQPTSA